MKLAAWHTRWRIVAIGIVALALSLPGLWITPAPYLAAYLAAWWFCIGIVMGGAANVWVHTLTGGRWGEPLREPLLRMSAALPLLALLFLPVLFGMHTLYPWAPEAASGAARWAGEVARPAFKSAWLMPGFFVARAMCYLIVWTVLGLLTARVRWQRSRPLACAALILYSFTVTLAGVDWIMSLTPVWFSTTFGLLCGVGQMLTGMAFVVAMCAWREPRPDAAIFHDWGNLLLMYVLTWAYLAYTQYLIIWAANLPHEIAWYVPRLHSAWWWCGWALILAHFFLPLLILLSRAVKRNAPLLGALAVVLLAAHLFDAWWSTIPSIDAHAPAAWWFAPLIALGLVAFVYALWEWHPRVNVVRAPASAKNKEPAHA